MMQKKNTNGEQLSNFWKSSFNGQIVWRIWRETCWHVNSEIVDEIPDLLIIKENEGGKKEERERFSRFFIAHTTVGFPDFTAW